MARITADDVHGVYQRQAAQYDAQRSNALFEARWLARFAASLTPGARVLDLGSGTGAPIARWFMVEGFAVTGADFSEAMLTIARQNHPQGDWRHADMRAFDLGEQFDGIIAWNSFFHLNPASQRQSLAAMARHLKPDGTLMITVGPRAGEAIGQVGDEQVYHASLSPAEYASCLEENGLRLTGFLAEDPKTAGHSVLMARKDLATSKGDAT